MKKLFIFKMLFINFNVNAAPQNEIQTSFFQHGNNQIAEDLSVSGNNNFNLTNDVQNKCGSCKEDGRTLLDDLGFDPVKSSIIKKLTSMNKSNDLNEKERPIDGSDNFYVFVSWSMPLSSLKMLAKEVDAQKAVLVFRGLKEDSFIKTASHFKELGEGAIIDPLLFRENNINVVPIFIRSTKDHSVQLKGNVTLSFAKEKLAEALLIEQKKNKKSQSNTSSTLDAHGIKK
ncbi:MAG: TrbC family F-type conjugative pilus assembly protein [Alphaproteobacteria bacterium]|nr:TrbC family F-type conjugative pilus assembly protein [Alphaproteobacteria bacterium]